MIYFGSNFRSASRGALHSPTFVYQVCALRCATTAVLNITGLAAVFASLSLSLLSNSPCFCGFWLWCCLLGCDIAAGQNCFCKTIKMILCWIFIQAREFPLLTDWLERKTGVRFGSRSETALFLGTNTIHLLPITWYFLWWYVLFLHCKHRKKNSSMTHTDLLQSHLVTTTHLQPWVKQMTNITLPPYNTTLTCFQPQKHAKAAPPCTSMKSWCKVIHGRAMDRPSVNSRAKVKPLQWCFMTLDDSRTPPKIAAKPAMSQLMATSMGSAGVNTTVKGSCEASTPLMDILKAYRWPSLKLNWRLLFTE